MTERASPADAGFLAHRARRRLTQAAPKAVVIGSSTGGPTALAVVLQSLGGALDIPIIVVQHMPPRFTGQLAKSLDARVDFPVLEAADGMIVEPGTCLIAPGGSHLELAKRGTTETQVRIVDYELVNFCKPSVEVMFNSAEKVYGGQVIAVMLTGMGRDGAKGAASLAALGAPVIAQDRPTSTVWGMPGAVVELGAASEILPLPEIGGRLRAMHDAMLGAPKSSQDTGHILSVVD